MSADPQMMAQMLASQLGGQQPQSVGGMQGQTPPVGAAAQMAQKIMLMRALQQGQPPQQSRMPPQPNIMGGLRPSRRRCSKCRPREASMPDPGIQPLI